MPLKVELPDVPPLKAVINRKTIYGWQKGGSTFTYQTTQLKIPILLHTEPRRYLNIVCSISLCQCLQMRSGYHGQTDNY